MTLAALLQNRDWVASILPRHAWQGEDRVALIYASTTSSTSDRRVHVHLHFLARPAQPQPQ